MTMGLSNKTISFLALWLIPKLGPKRIEKLNDAFSSIEDVFNTPPRQLKEIAGIDIETANLIPRAIDSQQLQKELKLIDQHGVQVIDQTDKKYPNCLREIHNTPPILYCKGDIDFNSELFLAFVGSRKSSFSGKNMCQRLIRDLSFRFKQTKIVSGLAIGIDSVAHEAALTNGLKTVAVLANGLSEIYPLRNRKLAEKIAENGAVITEFPMAVKPVPTNFPLRNRIVSGISRGVVVVEAGERSGASITAGYALEQNRELFALPGPADSSYYRGTNKLIQKGNAKLILDVDDILDELQVENVQISIETDKQSETQSSESLSETESKILIALDQKEMTKDELSNQLKIPIHQILAALTSLEIKGFLVSKAGSVYQKTSTD